jgi:tetratricopeptide (TPR) repeat protein
MSIGVSPARHEVERQLDRILADEVIASHPQPAKLLDFIVKRTLAGEEITEKLIREGVFPNPPYKEDSNIARITMDKVRKLLAEYYADEGEDDPVIIALPRSPEGRRIKFQAGGAYTPLFRYNPRSPIAKAFAVANHLLRGSVTQIDRGVKQLGEIWDMEPNHPDAILSYAEAVGTQLMLGLFVEEAREPLIAGALGLIERLDQATADAWRIHNVRGLLFMANGESGKAEKEFDSALALDRQATIDWGWYTLFLFQVGREEEAVQLQGLIAEEKAGNAGFQALHGIYLTNIKRYEEAERAFTQSLTLDRNCWPAHYGITQMYLATGKERKAEEHLKRLKALMEPFEYEDLKRRLGAASQKPKRGRGV